MQSSISSSCFVISWLSGSRRHNEVYVGLVVPVAVLVSEAGERHEPGLDPRLLEHLPDHPVDQVLARM